jgi:cullin 1
MAAITQFPMPPATADLATTWAFLEEGVDHIMTKLHTGVSYTKYMNLYTVSYNYCTSSKMHSTTSSEQSVAGRCLSLFTSPPPLLTYPAAGANLMGSDLYNSLVRYFVQHLRHLRDVRYRCYDDCTAIDAFYSIRIRYNTSCS